MSEGAEGEYVPDYLRTIADAIEDGTLRVSHAVAKSDVRETKKAHKIEVDRSIVGETVAIEVSQVGAVLGETVKTIKKSDAEMDGYEEFYAKAGETYKVVKADEE